jgi:3-phosphoshikimate 1-carboxyvinyltransferase
VNVRSRRRKDRPLTGSISVPGDKSLTHRALIVSALAEGRSVITHANVGDDALATARALESFGARVEVDRDGSRVEVEGSGPEGLREPAGVIDAGNSGTTIRTLLGVAAPVPGLTVLDGDASIRRRPMLRVVAPLRQMGAQIDGREHGDRAPLTVRGSELTGIDHELNVASAQVKTALLLAGLRAAGTTSVTEPRQSRDHTERMLAAAGVPLRVEGTTATIEGGTAPAPADRMIPGDISSALFLIVAALICPGSDLTVTGVGLNPTRTAALDVLRQMGADLEIEMEDERHGEPVGSVRARHSELTGVSVDPAVMPALIDEVPVLTIAASQATGTTEIRGAEELRIKESDRIDTMVTGLTAVGAEVEELPDGMVIAGSSALTGGKVESRGDHRVAMAFAVAGLVASDNVRIDGWSCVETSFPEFLDVLGEAQRR